MAVMFHVPVFLRDLRVAENFDFARVANAQPTFVGMPDVTHAHRVDAHDFGGDRVEHDEVRAQRESYFLRKGA